MLPIIIALSIPVILLILFSKLGVFEKYTPYRKCKGYIDWRTKNKRTM